MSVWDGVVVSALEKAYEKPPEKPSEGDADGDTIKQEPMDTAEN